MTMNWSFSGGKREESIEKQALGWNPQAARKENKTEEKLEKERLGGSRQMRRN
jgi:hypothetical protein